MADEKTEKSETQTSTSQKTTTESTSVASSTSAPPNTEVSSSESAAVEKLTDSVTGMKISSPAQASGDSQSQQQQIPPPAPPKSPSPNNNNNNGAAAVSNAGIPQALMVKHPLQYRWVLWYCKHDRSKDWEECLKIVTSFDTVEDFWALYNHIQLASGLNWSSDYYLFKEGIKPMWEDEQNVRGGRWLLKVDKQRRHDLLDHYWLELLMAMIGEQFEDLGEHICGGVVNVRNKGDKVSLWTRDSEKEDVNRRIGEILKQKLGVPDAVVYEAHKDTSVKQSSNVKPKMMI